MANDSIDLNLVFSKLREVNTNYIDFYEKSPVPGPLPLAPSI